MQPDAQFQRMGRFAAAEVGEVIGDGPAEAAQDGIPLLMAPRRLRPGPQIAQVHGPTPPCLAAIDLNEHVGARLGDFGDGAGADDQGLDEGPMEELDPSLQNARSHPDCTGYRMARYSTAKAAPS